MRVTYIYSLTYHREYYLEHQEVIHTMQAAYEASITQLRTCVKKIEHIQLESPYVYPCQRGLLLKERIRSLQEKIIPFKKGLHLNRDAIDENHCSSQ